MEEIIKEITGWSEAWAPLIPLTIYFIKGPKAKWTRPIFFYLIVTFILMLCADIVWKRDKLGIQEFIINLCTPHLNDSKGRLSNNIFYNINAVCRFLFLCWFFSYLGKRFTNLNRFIPWAFLLLVIINFIRFEYIHDFSSRLLTVEGVLILLYSLFYFHQVLLSDDPVSPRSHPHFWVVAGLTLFTAANFFIVLTYNYLISSNPKYSVDIWYIQNINYVILNIFIAIALYRSE